MDQARNNARAHVIVVGNEKGGVGKSTIAMHLTVAYLREGKKVVTIDLDSRQATFTRYIENRANFASSNDVDLFFPVHYVVHPSTSDHLEESHKDEEDRLGDIINRHRRDTDLIIIDSPGGDTYLSRLGHLAADTLITPVNDSFVDLDVLVQINHETMRILKPSHYSELVWENRKIRAAQSQPNMDWVVFRNRLSNLPSKNKSEMEDVMKSLSERMGFRLIEGFGERVIFRELFLKGLTLFDVKGLGSMKTRLSHIAAKQEINNLLTAVAQGREAITAEFEKTAGARPAPIGTSMSRRMNTIQAFAARGATTGAEDTETETATGTHVG